MTPFVRMVKKNEEIRTYRNKRSHTTRAFLKDLEDVNVFTKVPNETFRKSRKKLPTCTGS